MSVKQTDNQQREISEHECSESSKRTANHNFKHTQLLTKKPDRSRAEKG